MGVAVGRSIGGDNLAGAWEKERPRRVLELGRGLGRGQGPVRRQLDRGL